MDTHSSPHPTDNNPHIKITKAMGYFYLHRTHLKDKNCIFHHPGGFSSAGTSDKAPEQQGEGRRQIEHG